MSNIRTARRSGLILRDGRNRRETQWLTAPYASTTIAAGSTAVLTLVNTVAELALRPFTVIRIRGFAHFVSDQEAASENFGASIGFCVVSDQAVAVGITAVPTPETDRESDLWMLFESVYGRLIRTASGMTWGGSGVKYDSKAMRKVEEGAQLIQVMETPSGVSSAVIQDAGRILIKLH